MKYYEHFNRSILKAITFRCLVLVFDSLIIFTLTHRYDVTISVMILSNLSSTLLYLLHERLWNGVHWGKVKK